MGLGAHFQKMGLGTWRMWLKSLGGEIDTALDIILERVWELKCYLIPKKISDGEMTAILRRNGLRSFSTYVAMQKRGDFGRRNFLPGDWDFVRKEFETNYSDEKRRIIECAEKLLSGKFDLLGSGQVDMKRRFSTQGHQLDWQKEPISGNRYNKVFSNWRFTPLGMQKGRADVKGVWELSRCQHFSVLGQAYRLTGDERYASLFAKTIVDFISRNPPPLGVHWACPMDVSLRLVSWQIGVSFFQGSKHLTNKWWRKFLKSLVLHGRHIAKNLEYGTLEGKIIVSNHGLSNLFGLYWLSLNFPGIDAGCVWRGISEKGLEQQISMQILSDGGCFESSLPYHRLVVEIFLSAFALGQHHKIPFSEHYKTRLLSSLSFLREVASENGRLAQVGDADNGRAHILYGYGFWEKEQESIAHLLNAASVVLNIGNLKDGLESRFHCEGIFWRDVGDPVVREVSLNLNKTCYPISGFSILRNSRCHLLAVNSDVGTFGIGNHKHNDQLSFELSVEDKPLIVDVGSFCYTGDPEFRNWFRSTLAHNTIMIGETEQHLMDKSALFRLEQRGTRRVYPPLKVQGGCLVSRDLYEYGGDGGFSHTRTYVLSPRNILFIIDDLKVDKSETLNWNFNFHPSLEVVLRPNEIYLDVLHENVALCRISFGETVEAKLADCWYSSGYGSKTSTKALQLSGRDVKTHTTIINMNKVPVDVKQDNITACLAEFESVRL